MPNLLVLVPHPDDESYAFAGLMATAAKAGWRVLVECASSGERGERHDGAPSTDRTGPAREAELRESCRILSAGAPGFWRLPDGELREHAPDLIARTDVAIRAAAPDVVATLGPDGVYGHPDHIALHRAVEAVFASAGERSLLIFPAFPKGLFLPQYEKCIGMMGNPPNPAPSAIGGHPWQWQLDTRVRRDVKLAAVAAHRSQLPGGDPRAIFPPGIIDALLDVERYSFATEPSPHQLSLLEALGGDFALRSH